MRLNRQRRIGHWQTLLAGGVLLAAAGLQTPAALAQDDPENQAKLEELRATIRDLQNELDQIKSNRSTLDEELQAAEERVRETRTKVRELRVELQESQSRLHELRKEKEALSHVKKQQQGSVGQHVNAAYQLGQQSHIKLLLNQQDPAHLSRNLKYHEYLISARKDHIQSLNTTLARLETVEIDIAATVEAIESDYQQLTNEEQRLQEQQSERRQTIARLEKVIASTDQKLKAMEDDRKNLETLLERVVAVTEDFGLSLPEQSITSLKGKLPWPAQGKVLQKYGASRMENKLKWHGMLIGAEEGSPVLAIHHGQVIFADYLRGHGLLIIVDHGAGYMSLYAHNESLFKQLGEWVNSGEKIATVGQSGGQSTAALYFELRHQGKPTDPATWLSKA